MRIWCGDKFMTLEEKLNLYQKADQWILKQYTKLSKDWSDDKVKKTYLGLGGFACIGMMSSGYLSIPQSGLPYPETLGLLMTNCSISGFNFGNSWSKYLGSYSSFNELDNDGKKAADPVSYYMEKMFKGVRMPYLLGGVGFPGYVLTDSLINDSSLGTLFVYSMLVGVSSVAMSSSMYLKDRDSKLLDKQTSKVKEFFQNIFAQKQPEPLLGYSILK